ncbi:MAG: 50S ribosomal protein L1, partial [Planctomycetota bacterium]|nr:50S ribosomal protein L1 [Planctomycetota bacterium]
PLGDGIELLKSLEGPNFDESVTLTLKLGIDARKSDQIVRGAFSLPHGIGKSVTVAVFAEGEYADAAKEAGADYVGGQDLADKITKGWMDFDVAIAHPNMMRVVGKLGRVLGPQGKMPSPKAGTVVEAVGMAVSEFKAGKIEFRNDAGGNLHALMGKKTCAADKLKDNVEAFLEHVKTLRPSAMKGNFIVGAHLSATMSPGIELAVS